MSEAENSWTKWDIERFKFWQHDIYSASRESREAYKAALRREIEKDKHLVNKEYFLNKIDTVEP